MICPKKSLLLFFLFIIFLSTTASEALQPKDSARLRQVRGRIAGRSLGEYTGGGELRESAVREKIGRRSYDTRMLASLLGRSLLKTLHLQRTYSISSVQPSRLGRSAGQDVAQALLA